MKIILRGYNPFEVFLIGKVQIFRGTGRDYPSMRKDMRAICKTLEKYPKRVIYMYLNSVYFREG
jgi:hypothetical protein